MNARFATILFTPLLFATQQAIAQPRIDVEFVKPEGFSDIYPSGRTGTKRELDGTLEALRKIVVDAGSKALKTGDELKLEVLDVNLAGDYPPSQSLSREIRVMRNIDWPSMKVRYTLKRDGKVTNGEALISDMSYLMSGSSCPGSEGLCYERRMVERWFRKDLH